MKNLILLQENSFILLTFKALKFVCQDFFVETSKHILSSRFFLTIIDINIIFT